LITCNSDNISIEGHWGTWYVLEEQETTQHGQLFLLEHETYGDDAACLIVDEAGMVIVDEVCNGFRDYEEWLAGQ